MQLSTFATQSAISGLMHRSKMYLYSITSSARASSIGGTTAQDFAPRGASSGSLRRANGKQLVLSLTDFGPNAPF
jgi:hypothetical protein